MVSSRSVPGLVSVTRLIGMVRAARRAAVCPTSNTAPYSHQISLWLHPLGLFDRAPLDGLCHGRRNTGLSLLDRTLEKMMKRILAAAFALSLGGTAYAADMPMPYKAAAPAPVFSWTGCYLGGNGGGGRAKDDWQPFAGTPLATVHASSWFAGAQAGCDYQVSSVVFGIETQFDWSDLQGIAGIPSGGGSSVSQLSSKLDRFATATGRVGYAFDCVLLYVKGGAVFAHYNHGFGQEGTGVPLTPL
jgi:hypothetical protein